MIVYPNVDHFKTIIPQPKKYLYSSLTSKELDQTVFTLKQQEPKDSVLIIEISTCKGNFAYKLTNNKYGYQIYRKEVDAYAKNTS